MGGGDERENLIPLTAEDHFFAHLLLAKVHGAEYPVLWTAIMIMAGQKRTAHLLHRRTRRYYAWAREYYCPKGEKSPNYKDEKITLRNGDRLVTGTRYEFRTQHGLTAVDVTSLINGHLFSAKGWTLPDTKIAGPRRAAATRKANTYQEVYHWTNIDGTAIDATIADLADMLGFPRRHAQEVVNGTRGNTRGWYINKPKKIRRHGDPTVHTIKHVNGRELTGTRRELEQMAGLGQREISHILKNLSEDRALKAANDPRCRGKVTPLGWFPVKPSAS
jgi:hypothetical protein